MACIFNAHKLCSWDEITYETKRDRCLEVFFFVCCLGRTLTRLAFHLTSDKPLFWLLFDPYLILISHCSYAKFRRERGAFTSLDTMVLMLWFICVFRKIHWILMGRTVFKMNLRKNRSQNEVMRANGAGKKKHDRALNPRHDRATRSDRQQCGMGRPCRMARLCHIGFARQHCSVAATPKKKR